MAVDNPESKGIRVFPLQGLMSRAVLWEELVCDISVLSSLLTNQLLKGKVFIVIFKYEPGVFVGLVNVLAMTSSFKRPWEVTDDSHNISSKGFSPVASYYCWYDYYHCCMYVHWQWSPHITEVGLGCRGNCQVHFPVQRDEREEMTQDEATERLE